MQHPLRYGEVQLNGYQRIDSQAEPLHIALVRRIWIVRVQAMRDYTRKGEVCAVEHD
jgi:hypothetical protein